MGWRKKRVRAEAAERLTTEEADAIPAANRRGLYILFTGRARVRRWRVYDRTTGRCIASYWPHHRRIVFHFGPTQAVRVVQPDFGKAMELIRTRFDASF